MKTLTIVNSVALINDNIYLQSRLQNGIEVYNLSGEWIKTIEVDTYFGWTLKYYDGKLFYGTTRNTIEVYDLKLEKVLYEIEPVWEIRNKDNNFDGRHTVPSGFSISSNKLYVLDMWTNCVIIMSITGELIEKKNLSSLVEKNVNILRIDVSENNIIISYTEPDTIILMDKNFNVINKLVNTGSGPGEFEVPWDLSLKKDCIYVSDLYNHRVQVLDYNLNFLKSYGSWGTKIGEFNYVYGMDIQDNYAIFADSWSHGFQIWKKENDDLVPFKAIKKPNDMQVLRPNRIKIIDQEVVVSDYLNHTFKFYDLNLEKCVNKLGSLGFNVGEFRYTSGITKYEDTFYCIDTRSGKVTSFYNSKASICIEGHKGATMSPNSESFLKSLDDTNSIIKLASDITSDKYGNLYIADIGFKSIIKVDREYKITRIGEELFNVDNKTSFIGVFIYDDLLYATNPGANSILIFNLNGELLFNIDYLNLNRPTGISVDDKFIAIADRLNHRIVIINKEDYSTVIEIGVIGNKSNQFCAPWDVALFNQNIYVADSLNNRIQKIFIGDLYE